MTRRYSRTAAVKSPASAKAAARVSRWEKSLLSEKARFAN